MPPMLLWRTAIFINKSKNKNITIAPSLEKLYGVRPRRMRGHFRSGAKTGRQLSEELKVKSGESNA